MSGHKCPECGKVLPTEHGVKTHRGAIHDYDGAQVELVCQWCGDDYERHQAHFEHHDSNYCSLSCSAKGQAEGSATGGDGA